MKLFITLIVFLSNFVFAQNLPQFEGRYTFQAQHLKLIQARHQLLIQSFSDSAKNYMNELKNIGYSCQNVSSATFSCKKIDRQISENLTTRQAIIKKYENSRINFDRATSDYSLVNDAPSLKEYQMLQTSQMGQMKFDQTHLFILKDLVKIKLTKFNAPDVAYFNLTSDGLLSSVVQVNQNAKPNQNFISKETYTYLYELIYL